eukprot:3417608-Prymnesium_polylepis.1
MKLQLLVDDGVPRTPALQAIIEFLAGHDDWRSREGREPLGTWEGVVRQQPVGQDTGRVLHATREKGKYGWGAFKGFAVSPRPHRAARDRHAAVAA